MIQPVVKKWYFLLFLILLGSCGPSMEEKARQLALRDSFSIDSALKKEATVKRIFLHKAKLRKDSLAKAAHDSILHRPDSTKSADSLTKSSLHVRPASDSIRRRAKNDSVRRHFHLGSPGKTRTDSFRKVHKKIPAAHKDTSAD